MILILIALVLAAVAGAWMVDRIANWFIFDFLGGVIVVFSGIGLIIYAFLCFDWIAAGYKADLINAEYETTYSAGQVFWAGDVIDVIREIKRDRIEVNGNLMGHENNEN